MKSAYTFTVLMKCLFTVFLIGCVSGGSKKTNDSGVEVTYPDPEDDKDTPAFCNPTGKKGPDLVKCYEINEAIYQSVNDEAEKREPWFNFAPDNWAESTELDPSLIYIVLKPDEVLARLEQNEFLEIDALEVEKLSGKKPMTADLRPYLVRGLAYFEQTGSFSVFEKAEAILVRHDSTGTTIPAEKRTALIVFLATEPKAVYVDCQVTE
jgi:hypothetical protein